MYPYKILTVFLKNTSMHTKDTNAQKLLFKNINIFKRPMLIYKNIILMHCLFDGIISNLPKRGPF